MKHIVVSIAFSVLFTISCAQVAIGELSHYLFPEFTKGIVLMKRGLKVQKSLNYNMVTEEMVFNDNGKNLAIVGEEMERVDTVYISNRKFFVFQGKFVELIYHADFDLYAENRCRIKNPGKPVGYGGTSETAATTSYSSLLTEGSIYNLELPEGFETNPYIIYWLRKNNELNRFLNLKQLLKLYDDKKAMAKAFIKEHDVKFQNQESLIQLIQYLETD